MCEVVFVVGEVVKGVVENVGDGLFSRFRRSRSIFTLLVPKSERTYCRTFSYKEISSIYTSLGSLLCLSFPGRLYVPSSLVYIYGSGLPVLTTTVVISLGS